MRIWYNYKQEI